MHAVSRASFPLTLPSPARGEGEKKHVFNKIPPVPFFRAGARKDKSLAFGAGTYLAAHCRWVGRGMGPSRRLSRSARGQGPGAARGRFAVPQPGRRAGRRRSSAGRRRALGPDRPTSRGAGNGYCPYSVVLQGPPGGRCSRWCTGRFFKRSHPGGMPDDPQQPVHRGKRAFSATIKYTREGAAVKWRAAPGSVVFAASFVSACFQGSYGDGGTCGFVAGGTVSAEARGKCARKIVWSHSRKRGKWNQCVPTLVQRGRGTGYVRQGSSNANGTR